MPGYPLLQLRWIEGTTHAPEALSPAKHQVRILCVIRAKTDGRFGGSRTRKTADAVQPKRWKTYSGFG